MLMLLYELIFIVGFGVVMMSLGMILTHKINFSEEFKTSFECGFTPKNSARIGFNIHFYLITVIFLIFDVEIVLLLPFGVFMSSSMVLSWSILFFLFLLMLVLGLIYEWMEGALDWKL
uniref:NADH dehydrogenase subunit 3 n=1 Tax=Lophogaster typicus TaxID=419538 RepID=UPI002176BF97|nr:NADH dehydrogenase subunit 3 [Lophogaster typicus]UUL70710.1 NADH dehydrogenase subunit 3 [Lophogaster typicus]